MNIYTDNIWGMLAANGAVNVIIPIGATREEVVAQLHAEAKEEGVSLRINRAKNPFVLYVYLRKVA